MTIGRICDTHRKNKKRDMNFYLKVKRLIFDDRCVDEEKNVKIDLREICSGTRHMFTCFHDRVFVTNGSIRSS